MSMTDRACGGRGKNPRPQTLPDLLPRRHVPAHQCRDQVPQRLAGVAIVIVGSVIRHAADALVAVLGRDPHDGIGHVLFTQVVRPRKALNLRRHHHDFDPFYLHENRPPEAMRFCPCRPFLLRKELRFPSPKFSAGARGLLGWALGPSVSGDDVLELLAFVFPEGVEDPQVAAEDEMAHAHIQVGAGVPGGMDSHLRVHPHLQ